ncbi:MAG: 3-isopropylmalate dehydratase large subunit [Chloroflexi bacterium]|nr:3-isopropylmalate dehydratase large subunit [Chloroflexota bacterium]
MTQTLFEKIWQSHIVAQEAEAPAVIYIDLHLIHEVTSPQAFQGLRQRGLPVRRPDRCVATMDHSTPTAGLTLDLVDGMAARQIEQFRKNCQDFGIRLYDLGDAQRGIVHVIGPELGFTQPGMTIVCGDSHTSTHGAFGALAFGIGTSEVEHVLATQCLLQYKPRTLQAEFRGRLPAGVTAKDLILCLIAQIGIGGGTGLVIEYTGEAIRNLSMEERMTICNMSIEGGARAGMVAPDEVAFEYLAGRPYAPQGAAWERALQAWQALPSDPGAVYDQSLVIDVTQMEPMITYGTNPGMGVPITRPVPDPDQEPDLARRSALHKALAYMDIPGGQTLLGRPVQTVFIGSCTNGRISDLRQAASLLRGRKIAHGLRLLVVPGSETVRRQAEAEGLDKVFREAGGEWRYAGCSMCIAMNGDQIAPGEYAVSTSNRNFEGRQGAGGRTFLASPLTAAAAAIQGCVSDPRQLI